MARQRADENSDLPDYLYVNKERGYFRYRRPDTGRSIGLGVDKDFALRAAEAFNQVFGVKEIRERRMRLTSAQWSARVRSLGALHTLPAELRAHLPDLFPEVLAEKGNKKIRNWAEANVERRFKNGRRIKTSIDLNNVPGWVEALFKRTRRNAERRGITFELSVADVAELLKVSNGFCTVTGVQLTNDNNPDRALHVRRPWAPSIDRIESDQGYSLDNCRVVCAAANLAMNMWGEEVLLTMAKAIARKHLLEKTCGSI